MRGEIGQPRAKTSELVVKKVGEDVLVYDLTRHKAHSLNRVAAAVWQACDGTRGLRALSVAASAEAGQTIPEDAVRYALQSLQQAKLLDGPAVIGGLTRREVMARLGTAAAVVATITVPTAAHAVSCRKLNDPCENNAQCCGEGCGPTTSGCSCNLFKTFGLRCLRLGE